MAAANVVVIYTLDNGHSYYLKLTLRNVSVYLCLFSACIYRPCMQKFCKFLKCSSSYCMDKKMFRPQRQANSNLLHKEWLWAKLEFLIVQNNTAFTTARIELQRECNLWVLHGWIYRTQHNFIRLIIRVHWVHNKNIHLNALSFLNTNTSSRTWRLVVMLGLPCSNQLFTGKE